MEGFLHRLKIMVGIPALLSFIIFDGGLFLINGCSFKISPGTGFDGVHFYDIPDLHPFEDNCVAYGFVWFIGLVIFMTAVMKTYLKDPSSLD